MVGGHSPLQSAPASPNPPCARQEGEGRAFISSGAAKRQFPKKSHVNSIKGTRRNTPSSWPSPCRPCGGWASKAATAGSPRATRGSACSRKATACLRDPRVEERLGKHQRRLQFLWRRIRLERTPTASLPQDQVSESLDSAPGLHPAAHLTLSQGILLWLQEERRGCSHRTPSQGGNLDPELMD